MVNYTTKLVDELLERRGQKINHEKELERIKYEKIRESLIALFETLKPIKEPLGKLVALYRTEPNSILAYDLCKNWLGFTYSLKYDDFVLEKIELGKHYYYTLNELKHNTYEDFKEWTKFFPLKESDYMKTVNFMIKEMEGFIERLRKEVE